ncbi:hypothetical protein B0J11DRAFT_261034 [Dendryphion nanum]|uniref:Endosomal peripheral membrane protein n=1 Tax=Dendryphion nanum TaxID=256645 RepID=A0A9P9IRQ1_9PLEO|nr:hypothetical protein B0J11DRAFT_261034 [Dendryphion nanum]
MNRGVAGQYPAIYVVGGELGFRVVGEESNTVSAVSRLALYVISGFDFVKWRCLSRSRRYDVGCWQTRLQAVLAPAQQQAESNQPERRGCTRRIDFSDRRPGCETPGQVVFRTSNVGAWPFKHFKNKIVPDLSTAARQRPDALVVAPRMTAQILASELANLVQDSKRKNTELRNAAEKSLQDLKSLPVTSEAQLTADLSRRPHFISPFLIACSTHNAKFGSTGVACLQRLSVAKALPRERLTEVLEALKESVSLNHDVQLRILQALPSLLQNYPADIRGELLSVTLQICSALQNAKNFAVSNTAAATLQQLVSSIFDRVANEDERALEIPTTTEIKIEGHAIPVRSSAHDAYKVFNDLNLLVTGEKPMFIRFSSLPPTSTLELIETILSSHGGTVSTHLEQVYILRSLLMPMIIRSLPDRLSFPIALRIIRILNLLIRNYLSILPSECEIALGLLNHMLDPEASPLWKRALCLEVYRGIYTDSRLVLEIYRLFDEQEGKKSVFGDNLASFVRLATEKPAIIGLGQQSTIPSGRGDDGDSAVDQAVAEAGGLAGVIGGPVSEPRSTGQSIGISTQWSSLKTPCMENLDKSEAPALPETYVYSLVLTCITNISESLAKFILPLTVHHDTKGRKRSKVEDASRQRADSETASPHPTNLQLSRTQSFRRKTIPVNPLDLKDHPAYSLIETSAALVNECWPPVMATCSTFLNAALDSDYYRALVRAIQKFTQVAGLLRLSTPRDAFLTLLGKAAVPPSMLLTNVSSPKTPTPDSTSMFSNAKGLLSVDSLVSQASSMSLDKNRRPSHEVNLPTLGPRNLLCLRALLNLAIALGPTLHSAWSIILETLQVADLIIALSNSQSGAGTPGAHGIRTDVETSSEKVEAETAAVQAAARRLFESTVDFPNEAFIELLRPLCALLGTGSAPDSGQRTPTSSVRPKILHQRRMGSASGISLNTDTNSRDSLFALNKIGELASLNEARLAQYDPQESGWNILVEELVGYAADDEKVVSARLLAADILSRSVKEIAEISSSDENRNDIQRRILSALQTLINGLYSEDDANITSYNDADIRVHQIGLEALKSVIEQCGESLVAGWDSVFDSLLSVFTSSHGVNNSGDSTRDNIQGELPLDVKVISKALARSAFGTVQLVCSDFLAAVPDTSLATLLELLLRFSRQQDDLNMSLTTVTFFWNVSDFLHSRGDLSVLPSLLGEVQSQDEVSKKTRHQSLRGSIPALWLLVLMSLSAVTTDKRAEVRNSAVQTIQRIFENTADQLSPDTWMLCLRSVLFAMVELNLSIHRSIRAQPTVSNDDIASWNETTKTVLGSTSILIATYMENIDDASGLGIAWSDLLDYFEEYFKHGSHALGSSVFTTITGVLSKIESSQVLGSVPLQKTAEVWKKYFDYRESWSKNPEGNQEAFLAYAKAFKAIYQLSLKSLNQDLPSMLSNLEFCVVDSDAVAYSSDVDHMTALQSQVMDCLSIIRTDSSSLPSVLVQMLSRLSVLPYASIEQRPEKGGPTFVALAKSSMALLETTIARHIQDDDMFTSGGFYSALSSLAKPIQEKYIWQREGKSPTLWQKATKTSLAIIEVGLSRVQELKGDAARDVWTEIVRIASGIASARVSSDAHLSTVEKDERFDIEAFAKLRSLMTEPLGSTSIPDSVRRTYTRNLLETSIIHQPLPGEIPNIVSAPLEDLYRVRLGKTRDSEPVLRTGMAYVCFSELLSLVSIHDGSSERVKLAQATAPYLILRASLPLRAFIADHPLRGRMPAPESQRRELMFTLKELGRLKSEPLAIPDAPGASSVHRKHLHRLYPLLVKAMKVARTDEEVFRQLARLVDLVGEEFGVQDE